LIALALRRCSLVTSRSGPKHLGSRGAVDIPALGKGLEQTGIRRQVRHDAQLDLRVVGRQELVARWRDKGLADAPPLRVRIGMFCRLGSEDDSRPVAVTAWW
jgi:hypothetical protein